MKKITAFQVFRLFFLPGILPRMKVLFSFSFGAISYYIASIFRTARLLPVGHPYLNYANVGRFGVRHVMAEAGRNLQFKKENTDQILIYGLILLGLTIMTCQVGMLLFAGFVQSAHAFAVGSYTISNFNDLFGQPNGNITLLPPTDDVALIMLERVFGVPYTTRPGFFGTCVSQNIPCLGSFSPDSLTGFPWAFHDALRAMFEFYSIGMIVIGMLILCYFVVTVVAETAQSGTPFGKRFNRVWAPLRLVIAIGLLIPVANGLNAAQYITLYAAKWGSAFGTNGWNLFTGTITRSGWNTLLGNQAGGQNFLVANIGAPPVSTFIRFMFVVKTCERAEEAMQPNLDVDAYLVNGKGGGAATLPLIGTDFIAARNFYENRDIVVVFGERNDRFHEQFEGGVKPICGVLKLNMIDTRDPGESGAALVLQMVYDNMIQNSWQDADLIQWADAVVRRAMPVHDEDPNAPLPTAADIGQKLFQYQLLYDVIIQMGLDAAAADPTWVYAQQALGWGGAGIWYNKIAELNGAMVGAVHNLPQAIRYPEAMARTLGQKQATDAEAGGGDQHRNYVSKSASAEYMAKGDDPVATAEYQAFKLWEDMFPQPSGNIFIDAVSAVFGLDGLLSLADPANQNIHPLALLSATGKSLIDSAIMNMGASLTTGIGGGLAAIFQAHMAGKLAMAASGFFASIAQMGLMAGFILYYVLPFLPFIHFFFAVGGWVKGIFEAMVGLPLWALAHLRIDGNGMPGDAALAGYFMIFEIWLRPILCIFGLIAAISIYAAQVRVLNEIWQLVTSNLTGYDRGMAVSGAPVGAGLTGSIEYLRSKADQFFFTIIYAIIVYMLGISSFKLITQIPDKIMRWIGQNVEAFGDQSGDPTENMMGYVSLGANSVRSGLSSAMQHGGSAVQGGAQAILSRQQVGSGQ